MASDDPPALLELALSRPREAVSRARAVLASGPGPFDASVAHQALGIVLREFGDADRALVELRAARRLARRTPRPERETDVLATLGVTLVFAGRTTAGLRTLGTAVERAEGRRRGRIVYMRGAVQLIVGHHEEALRDLDRAVARLREADDPVWVARALTDRAFTRIALGAGDRAERDLARAGELFAAHGQELESADSVVFRGVLALRIGDVVAALSSFDEAAALYDGLGLAEPGLSLHRCAALLAAGLPTEAQQEAEAAVARLVRSGGRPATLAELQLAGAACALACGTPAQAREHARRAGAAFARQGRRWWRAHARLAELQAELACSGTASLREVRRCADALTALGSPEATTARLLLGRAALALGKPADEHLTAVATQRRRGPALARTVGWLAEALRAHAAGDLRRVRHACRAGLGVLDEHRGRLGAPELQARATAHGAELAALGLRAALASGRPRLLLEWSERSRATALAAPPVRPPDDAELAADLSALRETVSRLGTAQVRGLPTDALRREQGRRERAVRARVLRTRRTASARWATLPVAELLHRLGPRRLLEIVDVDGALHVLVVGDGRVRRFTAGRTAEALREVEIARFWLTRLAHGVSAADPDEVVETLRVVAKRCDEALLGPAASHLGDGPVTVVPPGRFHAVPWSMLPALRDRPVGVAPSAALWLRAAAEGSTGRGRTVLVRGPGVEGGELAALRRLHPDATVLDGADATAAAVLAALDGARLAHVAAHGTFRADSPLFSALRLADGPLTGYDLQRLHRAPEQVVLSSCDSAMAAAAGADELLGLACSLLPLGTREIAASIVPVSDTAVGPLMVALHRHLRGGAGMAEALRRTRAGADALDRTADDHTTDDHATAVGAAWSFVALGAG